MSNKYLFKSAPSYSSLFEHERPSVTLFLGHELLFSNRLYCNLKRHLSIIAFDDLDLRLPSRGNLFSAHKLIEFIRLNNIDTLICSSEVFLFCDAQFVLDFVESLREVYLANPNFKVIFCRIDYPAPAVNLFVQDSCIELIRSMYFDLSYMNTIFVSCLQDMRHLTLDFSSYISLVLN